MATVPGYDTYLREGMTDKRVGQLQGALSDLGYDVGPIDNIFGPKTAGALRQFQTEQDIQADAIYGPETAGALQQALAGVQPATQPTQQPVTQPTAQPLQQIQQPVQQTPQQPVLPQMPQFNYQSPYTGQIQDIIQQLQGRQFQYDPAKDIALQQAQQQAINKVSEEMASRGILSSTITADRAAQEAAILIPQYRQIAFNEYMSETDRLMDYGKFLQGLDQQSYNRIADQWARDWKQKEFQYQQALNEIEISQQNIDRAWDRVNELGYVDNEASQILGVPAGTPSRRAREFMEQIEAENRAAERDLQDRIALERERFQNELDLFREKQEISGAAGEGIAGYTQEDVNRYNQLLDAYLNPQFSAVQRSPEETLRYALSPQGRLNALNYLNGNETLYNELINELQRRMPQEQEITPEQKLSAITKDLDELSAEEALDELIQHINDYITEIGSVEYNRLVNAYERKRNNPPLEKEEKKKEEKEE
ncbi:MAG: peptidoglycan-binding protein [Deltaproteobacteria bacterium]|nr:peptidoglycan-binding protein [Deltaproteobacteria bacterium]